MRCSPIVIDTEVISRWINALLILVFATSCQVLSGTKPPEAGLSEQARGVSLNRPTPVPTVSPYLSVLQANGITLSEHTRLEVLTEITLDQERFTILEYEASSGEVPAIQILRGTTVEVDQDVAFRVLLTYAWLQADNQMRADELKTLAGFLTKLQDVQQRSDSWFKLAHAVDPILERIDKLKEREIHGVPLIHNWWDAICFIPLDAADLCLLEIPARILRDQGIEVEQLLAAAINDLSPLVDYLEALSHGETRDGRTIKEATDKSLSSLRNLADKSYELSVKIADMQGRLGQLRERIKAMPELQAKAGDFPILLERLDTRMSEYRARVDGFVAEIDAQQMSLEDVRGRTDETLRDLGRRWVGRDE